jgi:hypothetical protein
MATAMQRSDCLNRQKFQIEQNVTWLRQAVLLIEQLDDRTYRFSPPSLAPHRVGGHMRHILEFYECFLDGLEASHIDYDARKRDEAIEASRTVALSRIQSIIQRLERTPELRRDSILWVRVEDSPAVRLDDSFMTSSVSREMQVLSSHTIHHFALIAMTLAALGHPADREFGMAPSTLRFNSLRRAAAASVEAA